MNLDTFKSAISEKGLAKNFNWICRIYPPKGLTSNNNVFSFDLGNGFDLNLNLPGLDLLDDNVSLLNDLSFSPFDGLEFFTNKKLPTLGFLLSNSGKLIDGINLFCNSCSIPERDVKNMEWQDTAGESRQLGYGHNHSRGVSVNYFCSEDLRERLFFEQWQNIIYNPVNARRGYYDDYIGRMEIIKYNASWSKQEAIYQLEEVYPSNVSAQTLNYEGAALLRLDIQFKYKKYKRIK